MLKRIKIIFIIIITITLTGCKEKITNNNETTNNNFRKEECLESYLGGLISSLPELEEKNLNEIIDINLDELEYYKVKTSENKSIYVIVKTKNQNITKAINEYFNNNYNNYQQAEIEEYNIYLYNGFDDYNLYEDYIKYEEDICKEKK